jgi:hypothetical protein
MFKNVNKAISQMLIKGQKQFSSLIFDQKAVQNYKDNASFYRDTVYQKFLYDLNLKNLLNSMFLITKKFETVVFVGPNPESFLLHKPSSIN